MNIITKMFLGACALVVLLLVWKNPRASWPTSAYYPCPDTVVVTNSDTVVKPTVVKAVKPWDHICPLCKQDGKKSTLKDAGVTMVFRGGIIEEPSRYRCSREHRIVYVDTGTNWTVTASEYAEFYWNENGKLISPRWVRLTNEVAKVDKPISTFIGVEAFKDLKKAYDLGVRDAH